MVQIGGETDRDAHQLVTVKEEGREQFQPAERIVLDVRYQIVRKNELLEQGVAVQIAASNYLEMDEMRKHDEN